MKDGIGVVACMVLTCGFFIGWNAHKLLVNLMEKKVTKA